MNVPKPLLVIQSVLSSSDGVEKVLKLISGCCLLYAVNRANRSKDPSSAFRETESRIKAATDTLAGFHVVARLRDAVSWHTMSQPRRVSRLWLTVTNICETLLMLQSWRWCSALNGVRAESLANTRNISMVLCCAASIQDLTRAMRVNKTAATALALGDSASTIRRLHIVCDAMKMALAAVGFMPPRVIVTYSFSLLVIITYALGLFKLYLESASRMVQ